MSQWGIAYEDLVAAADVVVTKPGYGMIAECAVNDTAMLYTSRGRFPEYEVLVAGLPGLARAAFIGHDDLFAGRLGRAPRRAAEPAQAGPAGVERRAGGCRGPGGAAPLINQSLVQVTSDQMRGMLTFSIETGVRSACARNAGRSRSALKPM